MTSISSAKASRSPLDLTSSNLLDDLIASSRYTLNNTGDSTDPCGSPISASICYSPTYIVDYLCNFIINSTIAISLLLLHLFFRRFQSISRSTESYAFYKSISRWYLLFLLPCTSLRRRLAWMAVDLPSLNPVWYTFDSIRCWQLSLTFARIAFSIIFEMCDLTTFGLMSSSLTGPLVSVFWSGTSLPSRK